MMGTLTWLLLATGADDLQVSVTPAHLVLGQDAYARVTVAVPVGATEVRLSTNVGEIADLRLDGSGRYVARFRPPAESHPQVAILAAVAHSDGKARFAWRAIPLWGRGEAIVHTQPFAEISVHIKNDRFGPVKADGQGIALVPIVVPPGESTAYEGVRPIDLHLPATSHVHVVLGQTRVRADQQQEVIVRAFAVNPDGSARKSPPMELTVTRGALGPPVHLRPGEVETLWVLPPGRAGAERVVAKLRGSPTSVAEAELAGVGGAAVAIELHADREAIVATDPNEVMVRALTFDSAGNRTEAEVQFEASFGSLVSVAHPGVGEFIASYRLPANFENRSRWQVRARVAGAESGEASSDIPLRPAPAHAITITPAGGALVADGVQTIELRVEVRDQYGNPVDAPIAAAAAQGRIDTVSTGQSGGYLLRYTPPAVSVRTTTKISVSVESATSMGEIELLPAHDRLVVAANLGLMSNFRDITVPRLGLQGEAALPWFHGRLAAGLDAGYFSFERSAQAAGSGPFAGQAVDGAHRFLGVTAAVVWRQTLSPSWFAWLGTGAGAAIVWTRVRLGEQPAVRERGTAPIAQVVAGVGWRLMRGAPVLEARYLWYGDPGMQSLRGSLSALVLDVGYRFEIW